MHRAINVQEMPIKMASIGKYRASNTVTTTLYHLIAGLQTHIAADNDELLIALVQHLMGTGRVKFLRGCHNELKKSQ